MTISEKIFELLKEKGMSRKDFSKKTGIPLSTIGDWKRKNTNPASDKILIICETLEVTPYELLSGREGEGKKSRRADTYVIAKDTEMGRFLESYGTLDPDSRKRIDGYLKALLELKDDRY